MLFHLICKSKGWSCSSELRREGFQGQQHPLPCFTLLSSTECALTPLLHEDEEVIQELLPFGVTVQFIELGREIKMKAQPTTRQKLQ